MSLETKGTIKFNPDVKPDVPEYTISVKQLGITAEGSGNVEQMMDELTERVRREMSDQFGISRCDVQMVKYSITCTFDVSAPINRTLDEFSVAVGEQKGDDTECTITFGDNPPIKTDMGRLELARKAMEVSQQTGIPPETLIKVAKARAAKKDSKGVPE